MRDDGNADRLELRATRAVESAMQAIKGSFALNGGAAIAALGFLASTFDKGTTDDLTMLIADMRGALAWFASGAMLAAMTWASAYVANRADYELARRGFGKPDWWGEVDYWLSIALVVGSFVAFGRGVYLLRGIV
jgi:hypothetical protein